MEWKLSQQLCFLLYANARHIMKAYKPFLDPYGLTYTQYITMISLWENDHQLVGELGTKLSLDSGTLTPLLKKLEKDGRIIRIRDVEDERKVIIHLTDEGKILSQKMKHVPYDVFKCVNLPEEEVQQLFVILSKLYQQDQACEVEE
ncbi:MAG: MarR family transcriptional regulator [Acholeplasmataceae bacterium]|jgi:DNA-binding MarR family transcriptional regulator|nr:MarR family transcriptional regulator [Acholeplasmataceae bacterium]